jgi:hypothetical protein
MNNVFALAHNILCVGIKHLISNVIKLQYTKKNFALYT